MLYLSKTTDILEGPVVCNYDLCFFQNKDHFGEKQVLIMDLKLRFNTECINQGGSTSFRENTFLLISKVPYIFVPLMLNKHYI